MSLTPVQPPGWKRPRGYVNGMLGTGRTLFVAGQIGWDAQEQVVSDELPLQWDQALQNVLTVVRAAGGEASHVARMTVYVTDKDEYVAHARAIGEVFRRHMGGHYPAMSLVQVAALLEPRAKVEIEVTAVLPEEP